MVGPHDQGRAKRRQQLRSQILMKMADGRPRTLTDILNAVGMKPALYNQRIPVYQVLSSLVKEDILVKGADKIYELSRGQR